MRHVLSLFALALVPTAHAPGGHATAPYIRIYDAPHNLSTGVTVTVKAQESTSSTFSSWWWGSQVWFRSSNTAVVTVTDAGWNTSAGVVGTIKAVGPGTATITVYDEQGGTATDEITVSGTGAPLASIRIQCANGAWCDKESGRTISVGAGTNQQMFVVGLDASGNVLWKAPVQ
jgi:hypothetical protein